jgi:hypothetical protein
MHTPKVVFVHPPARFISKSTEPTAINMIYEVHTNHCRAIYLFVIYLRTLFK